MKKLFYENVHQTDFDAIVTECIYDEKKKIYKVVLDHNHIHSLLSLLLLSTADFSYIGRVEQLL